MLGLLTSFLETSTILQILIITSFLTTLLFAHLLQNYLLVKNVPGPLLYSLTKWRLAYDDWTGSRTRSIDRLHRLYGPIVRLGPNELAFNSLSALKTIYGAGSGFERTSFYRMFDVYGHQNLFTFAGAKEHGDRKKVLAHAYSKSSILKNEKVMVESKVGKFMELLEREPGVAGEVFASLHYFSLDNITHFLYGEEFGATDAMGGCQSDRSMLNDVLDPKRRKLAWFACHWPKYTKWLLGRTRWQEKVVEGLGILPMGKPTTYTGIRKHALGAWYKYAGSSEEVKVKARGKTIVGRLGESGLGEMECASEAADHLLAGVDTTADSLMFLFWAMSLPENQKFQDKLIEEVQGMKGEQLGEKGMPTVEASMKLVYLDAVIRETLRLYAPLPASEPRVLGVDCVVDGVKVPKNTVVSMSPYSLHRNGEVFKDPLVFNPERWFGPAEEAKEMNRWFWAFGSGGRMCIGLQ